MASSTDAGISGVACAGARGKNDPCPPPRKGEERRGLWRPRWTPGFLGRPARERGVYGVLDGRWDLWGGCAGWGDDPCTPPRKGGGAQGSMASSTDAGISGVAVRAGGMTLAPLPARGRSAGVYGVLDGRRDFWGSLRGSEGERMTPAPLPARGRSAGVYGVLDGRRDFWGSLRGSEGERMTPAPLPARGRSAGVYGVLDGRRVIPPRRPRRRRGRRAQASRWGEASPRGRGTRWSRRCSRRGSRGRTGAGSAACR